MSEWFPDTGATHHGVFFEFHPSFVLIKDQVTRKTLLQGRTESGLYKIPASFPVSPSAHLSERVDSVCWHRRLGHQHQRVMRQILTQNNWPCSTNKQPPLCHGCQLGKSSRLSLPVTKSVCSAPLELVFSDVWGPSPMPSTDGHRYLVLFLDVYSKYLWYFPFSLKSDVYQIFVQFQTMVERQFSTSIKQVQTDWGGEYRSLNPLIFKKCGVIHCLPYLHTHEQNGKIERRHRHVVETGLSLLAHAAVLQKHWHFAFETAVYLINRLPSPVSRNLPPFQLTSLSKTTRLSFFKNFWLHVLPISSSI